MQLFPEEQKSKNGKYWKKKAQLINLDSKEQD